MNRRFIAAHVPGFKDEEALDELRRVGLGFSPGARVYPADGLVVEISGMERLYGGRFVRLPFALQAEIKKQLGFRHVSIGTGPTAFTAMLCARAAPPDGMVLCGKGEEARVLAPLPVTLLPGISRRSLQAMARYNIRCLGEIMALPSGFLERRLGKEGARIRWMAQGQDPGGPREGAKTEPVTAERTFSRDTNDLAVVEEALRLLSDRVAFSLRERKTLAQRLTLYIIYPDGKDLRRSAELETATSDFNAILEKARPLMEGLYIRRVSLRGLRLRADDLKPQTGQMGLFTLPEQEKRRKTGEALDSIRRRMGFGAIVNANILEAALEEKGNG